jgi:hypothetical protein
VRGSARTNHGHEGNDSGASCDELDRLALFLAPEEPSTEGPSQLEAIADCHLLGEIGGYFSIGEPFNRDLDSLLGVRRSSDRVRADRGISIGSRQPNVDMLTCKVPRPILNLEGNRPGRGGLIAKGNYGSNPPHQSPQ